MFLLARPKLDFKMIQGATAAGLELFIRTLQYSKMSWAPAMYLELREQEASPCYPTLATHVFSNETCSKGFQSSVLLLQSSKSQAT